MPLRRVSRILVLAALAGLAACAQPTEKPAFYQDLGSPTAQVDPTAALGLINSYRQNNGLGALTVDPALNAIAQEQANALAARDSVQLSLSGERAIKARLEAAGYAASSAVENVSAGYRTTAEAFSGWRELKTHNAHMLDPDATRFGIATAYAPNSKYKVFWAAIFAAPASAAVD
ncbi:CAP domain-containing protein [Amorphus coralli]|uniref:CAP domain-containing protein n=1 Tax=Amorphus coralli TaxID=340680 RepID=UPI000370EE3C|nr:CAP domain-containing protein [Amorphus coralli]